MTQEQELVLQNFAQDISLGHMTIALEAALSYGEEDPDLTLKIRVIQQLQALFTTEYGKESSDLALLKRIMFLINSMQNNFTLEGRMVVAETEILPVPPKKLNIGLNVISKRGVLVIRASDLTQNNTTYIDHTIEDMKFILQATGVGLLTEGVNYELLASPLKGFRLLNNFVLGPSDFIVLIGTFNDSKAAILAAEGATAEAISATEDSRAATTASLQATVESVTATDESKAATILTTNATGLANTAIQETNTATISAYTAGDYANAQGAFANDKGILANNAAVLAGEKTALTVAATIASNDATQDAIAKTVLTVAATQDSVAKTALAVAATQDSVTKTALAVAATTAATTATTNTISAKDATIAATTDSVAKTALAVTATSNANTATTTTNAAKADAIAKTALAVAATTNANNAAALANAAKGWTPVTAIVADGIREVEQLIDYVGGTGAKPTVNIGSYVTATGFTTIIANAKNIKGSQGLAGISRIPVWAAGIYAINSSVLYLGRYWTSNAATVAGDIPGTSVKWVEDLTAYSTPAWVKTITADDITNWNNAYKVYGIEKDKTIAATTWKPIGNLQLHRDLPIQSLMKRHLLKDDGTVNYYLDANNSNLKADGTPAILDGTDGQVMTYFPEFYVKFEEQGNIQRALMSLYPFAGATRLPECTLGSYEGTIDRAGLKLSSVVNTTPNFRGGNNNAANDLNNNTLLGRPASLISRTNFTLYARNRGSVKWVQNLHEVRKRMLWLYVVEFRNSNCQLPFTPALTPEGYKQGGLGAGVTDASGSDWGTFNGYYPFVPCGVTNSLGNNTGEVDYTPAGWPVAKTFKVPSYRGVENPFGHIWEWTEGINLRIQSEAGGAESQVYTAKSLTFSDSNYNNYNKIGLMARTGGYIKEIMFGQTGEIMPLVAIGASSTTYWADLLENSVLASGEALRGVFSGGDASNGANAGLGSSNTNAAPSAAYASLGSRLCFMPEGVA